MAEITTPGPAFRDFEPEGISYEELEQQKQTLIALSRAFDTGALYLEGELQLPGGWKLHGHSDGRNRPHSP